MQTAQFWTNNLPAQISLSDAIGVATLLITAITLVVSIVAIRRSSLGKPWKIMTVGHGKFRIERTHHRPAVIESVWMPHDGGPKGWSNEAGELVPRLYRNGDSDSFTFTIDVDGKSFHPAGRPIFVKYRERRLFPWPGKRFKTWREVLD